jgi:hypothetical protein
MLSQLKEHKAKESYVVEKTNASGNVNLLIHLGIQVDIYADIGLIGFTIDSGSSSRLL